jgi:hypothetical protein
VVAQAAVGSEDGSGRVVHGTHDGFNTRAPAAMPGAAVASATRVPGLLTGRRVRRVGA